LDKEEKKKISDGLILAFITVALMWIVKLIETNFNLELYFLGIRPRNIDGIVGIFTTAFIHGDFMHLFNNSVPIFVGIVGISYFFPKRKFEILIYNYLGTHILVWIFAIGDSYHIGSSGVVYAYMSFLFFAAAFSNNTNMLALALAIIFAYGTMVIGLFPIDPKVSWESHLMGGIVGLVFALTFRKHGPKPKKYEWEDEEENIIEEMTEEEVNELIEQKRREMKVKYWYKPRKD
jgi:membrane associated rhomboid family serine protease